jgi:hypothetical protein
MRFRAGLVVGFGAGFYLGAMSGRERYHQINRMLRRAKRSEVFDTATGRAKAAVDIGVERARDVAGGRFGRNADAGLNDMLGARLVPAEPDV